MKNKPKPMMFNAWDSSELQPSDHIRHLPVVAVNDVEHEKFELLHIRRLPKDADCSSLKVGRYYTRIEELSYSNHWSIFEWRPWLETTTQQVECSMEMCKACRCEHRCPPCAPRVTCPPCGGGDE